MNMETIPAQWKVNVKEIDIEHQSLYNLIQDALANSHFDQKDNWPKFETFYKRLSQLMAFEEDIMIADKSRRISQYKDKHKSSLERLKISGIENDPNLINICKETLFSEIIRADFYHNLYRGLEGITNYPTIEADRKYAS